MANKLEQIAENKRRAALAKQEADVAAFAKKVADEVLGGLDATKAEDLKSTVTELASSVAQAVIASNDHYDSQLKDNFTQLLNAVKLNRPDNTSLAKLNKDIGKSLAKFETALERLELAPQITVNGLTQSDLKTEVDKVLAKLPKSSQREVTIAYENAPPGKYLNVRLTDGINHYKALGGGGGGGSGGLQPLTGYDSITYTPATLTDTYVYKLSGSTVMTIVITYTNSSKAVLSGVTYA